MWGDRVGDGGEEMRACIMDSRDASRRVSRVLRALGESAAEGEKEGGEGAGGRGGRRSLESES